MYAVPHEVTPIQRRTESVHIGCGAHPASYSVGIEVLSRGYSGRGVTLTTHLHLALRLRMSGAIPLLPPVCLHGMEWDKFILFTLRYLV
jgi:hypothetical protein